MNDRSGLSIFDDDNNNGADDATQVFSAVEEDSATASMTPVGSSFPVVRRGYDQAAVDRQMHTLAGEKAGVTASLKESRA